MRCLLLPQRVPDVNGRPERDGDEEDPPRTEDMQASHRRLLKAFSPENCYRPEYSCPRHINIIQYVGQPLTRAEVVAGFDLLPTQVAAFVPQGTAKLSFELTADVQEVITRRELRLSEFGFAPIYVTPQHWYTEEDINKLLLKGATRTIRRIAKYVQRGFVLVNPSFGPAEHNFMQRMLRLGKVADQLFLAF